MEVFSNSKARHIKWKEMLMILLPIIIYLIGLSITGFKTLIQHGDAIQATQIELTDLKKDQKELKGKIDDKFDQIQTSLMEIKLMLKDKQDRKN